MIEHHPYGIFVPPGAKGMIIGSFPIGKFTHPKRRKEIKPHEIDFFFGGEKNLLWKLLGGVFNQELKTKLEIIRFLNEKKLAVGDVINSCERVAGSASDSDLKRISWNYDLHFVIQTHHIKVVYFTSKKVEQWFSRLFPEAKNFKRVVLYSPSAQSARSLVRTPEYQQWKKSHPEQKTYDFLLYEYRKVFRAI